MAGAGERGREPEIWIGTSGWEYRHWRGIFYPATVPARCHLPFFAERFRTVEVNFSFYRLPERRTFERWREETPEGFLFAVKASRYLTHVKKLADPEEPLQRLMEHAGGLGEKLGPVLFQFPATWPIHLDRLECLLAALERYPDQRFTFEFRHSSWLVPEVFRLLEEAGAALCLPVAPGMPCDVRLTTDWSYIRMHGGRHGIGFSDEELEWWAGRIAEFRGGGATVFTYFNNDPEGHALRDAERLRGLLGLPAPGAIIAC